MGSYIEKLQYIVYKQKKLASWFVSQTYRIQVDHFFGDIILQFAEYFVFL